MGLGCDPGSARSRIGLFLGSWAMQTDPAVGQDRYIVDSVPDSRPSRGRGTLLFLADHRGSDAGHRRTYRLGCLVRRDPHLGPAASCCAKPQCLVKLVLITSTRCVREAVRTNLAPFDFVILQILQSLASFLGCVILHKTKR